MRTRVALVTHELCGGLGTMTSFLYRVLKESGRYQPEIILLATSASDKASVQIRAPRTWKRGVQETHGVWRDIPYTHVGAWASELEFQRYKPRPVLTALLEQYDILQFVAGSPPWLWVASDVQRPLLLWTATTTRADRTSALAIGSWPRRIWASAMTHRAESYEQRALRRADTVFALSHYTFSCVRSVVHPSRLILAHCGVDTNLFCPAAPAAQPYIISAARFSDPRKNIKLLLTAYASLKEKLSSLPRLYLVGEAPSQSARELLDQLQLGDVVHILGPKEPEALAELYQQALCFALSSDEEGLGIVILEAMASGLPVVSTACGGPTSSVVDGTTGFLTPVGDAVALADALQRLIEDPDLARGMGEAGRIRAEKNFSLQVSGRPFLTAYDNTFDRTRIDKRISRWDGSDLVGERSTLETNPFVKR